MNRRLWLCLPLTLFAATASGQAKPFKVICVEEKSTGFNWDADNWVQKNFKANKKIIIQKIDMEGSTPLTRTLQISLIMGQEECHATEKKVQRRVQA